jgi:putative hydrolase of the HAD superfamily
MPLSTFFFDLDETLYPSTSGLWEAIRERINLYMRSRLNLPEEEISPLRRRLFTTYGTTMRGLQTEFGIDQEEYLAFVHDLPLTQYLQPDPAVRGMLLSYKQRKIIFTNADTNHARRVLKVLQLDDCFEGIIDIHTISPYCKPMPEAFKIALQVSGETDAGRCMMVDDAPSNLAAARQLGFYTVRTGKAEPGPEYHSSILYLTDLPQALESVIN